MMLQRTLLATLAGLLLLPASVVRADNSPTAVRWKGWTVASSEALWRGRKHPGYPLTYLFDGDPGTAWVFSGTQPEKDLGTSHYLWFELENPVAVDEIRIMNGYNKSRAVFFRNNRAVEVRIAGIGDDPKVVSLPDEMGWHRIPLTPGTLQHLTLEFTRQKQGSDGDLCISELAFYHGGRKIDVGMPALVIGSDGGEAESNTSYLMTRAGKRLVPDQGGPYESGGAVWNADGRLVAGLERPKVRSRLWIADAKSGRVLFTRGVPHLSEDDEYEITWQGERRVRLKILYLDKTSRKPRERVLLYSAPG